MPASPLFADPKFVADLTDSTISERTVSARWGMARSSVHKWRAWHRKGNPLPSASSAVTRVEAALLGDDLQRRSDDSVISAIRISDTAWGLDEWREFLRQKGENPDQVTFTYGFTSNPTGGYWNKLNNVRRIEQSPVELDWAPARAIVDGFTYKPAPRDFLVDAAILQPTDEQWGKTDYNGGTPQTEERVLASYSGFADYVREYKPRQVLLARTGDGIENTCSTNSQRDTNDLDVPHMLVQSFKMDLHSLKMIAPLAGEVIDARVPSNHGRWRTGLKEDAGNPHADFGIGVGRQLEDTQRLLDVLPNVRFMFPDKLMESMSVQLDTARLGLVHGHQFGSADKAGEWWAKQDHGRMPTWDADVLLVGHWHSFRLSQSGDGRWIVIGPASDPGSSWFSNLQGDRATSGMNAFVLEGKRIRFQEIL